MAPNLHRLQRPILLHRTAKALVLDTLLIRILAVRLPWLFSGRALHRMALGACAAAAFAAAAPLFERAAERYLVDLEVESLARLRVHQLIARVRATREPLRDAAMCLEVEQRLLRLEWIDALEPPFELIPARRLLANWLIEQPLAAAAPGSAA
ncbi:MAG: hypothetical protein E6K81_07930 [Candidatus Eisenbacteria bacterium]|uniref:Uncharacterized protein n=1 Tax=Eiseniibacteriota bacterium TaxID=2212470 RepID=A0A538U8P3_UNCEI|nr:MAG: hypothetical protein E6K81_07930 [Candidatus Eisenbacteria bacterium]